MRSVLRAGAVLALLCSVLILATQGAAFGPVSFAMVAVVLLSLLTVLSLGELAPSALVAAAAGALLLSATLAFSVPMATAFTMAAVFAPRIVRARSLLGLVLAGLCALGGGALAGAVIEGFAGAGDEGVVLSAVVVATLLAALTFVIPVDDPMADRFRSFARRSTGVQRRRMVRALLLRRRAAALAPSLSRRTRERSDRAWRMLVRAADGRIEGARTSREVLDQRIRTYLQVLQRSLFAAGRARELSEDLDDAVLAELRLESEDLAATASALEEVRQGPRSPAAADGDAERSEAVA